MNLDLVPFYVSCVIAVPEALHIPSKLCTPIHKRTQLNISMSFDANPDVSTLSMMDSSLAHRSFGIACAIEGMKSLP